jgi:Protein of unknown function (DUF3307)
MNTIFILFVLFQIKHFFADFPLQDSFQYLNKGTWGHPGGYLHSAIHSALSLLILTLVFWTNFRIHANTIMFVVMAEFLIHYFTDLGKVNLNNYFKWKPDNSEKYWWLLGFDQLIHQLTYIWIIWKFV